MKPLATTRKRLTLVDLDKRCGARKPAPRARASAAALGADVLAQIELLRGRMPGARKRGIAALLDRPARKRQQTASATARAYDTGAPIQVRGSASTAFSASLATDGASWRAFAYRADDDPVTTGFTVEVYEEDPQRATGQPEPAIAIAPASPPTERAVLPAVVLPVATPAAPPQTEVPVAAALSAGQREDGFLGLDLSAAAASDREDAEQFEREIQAILSGKTTRPMAQAVPASSAAPATPPAVAAPRPHDIFEQMGQNMAYATSFNLPPMELGRRLDDLEREIALEEQAQERRPASVSLELSDDDISESLGLARALKDMAPPVTLPRPEIIDVRPTTITTVTPAPAIAQDPQAVPPPAAPAVNAAPATAPPATAPAIAVTPPPAGGPDAPAAPPAGPQTTVAPPVETNPSQPAPDGRSKP